MNIFINKCIRNNLIILLISVCHKDGIFTTLIMTVIIQSFDKINIILDKGQWPIAQKIHILTNICYFYNSI